MAPTVPACVGDSSDHQEHLLFWSIVNVGRTPSVELVQASDAFEATVNAHFDSLEPVGEDWNIREVPFS